MTLTANMMTATSSTDKLMFYRRRISISSSLNINTIRPPIDFSDRRSITNNFFQEPPTQMPFKKKIKKKVNNPIVQRAILGHLWQDIRGNHDKHLRHHLQQTPTQPNHRQTRGLFQHRNPQRSHQSCNHNRGNQNPLWRTYKLKSKQFLKSKRSFRIYFLLISRQVFALFNLVYSKMAIRTHSFPCTIPG